MRTVRELLFRLRQEAVNASFCAFPPRCSELRAASPLALLPNPHRVAEELRGTDYAADLICLADQILHGRVPILGTEIDYGRNIAWRRDPLRGIETQPLYFRRIPYLNLAESGDHKLIWEINRHQHLVLLAQAFVLTLNEDYCNAVISQLCDWWAQNPFQRGINWTSALEVAFRALSWIWIWHLIGTRFVAPFKHRFLTELYRHGLHLEYNLSLYFSPNTHLLGEAVALHSLGRLFPEWPKTKKWRAVGRNIVTEHLKTKVKRDGSYYEQSTYYQVYALDMFLFHAVLEEVDEDYLQAIERMTEFLTAVAMPDGTLPFLGDDDGGRFFHPFGNRARFAPATTATASALLGKEFFSYSNRDMQEIASWWLGPRKSTMPVPKTPFRGSSVFRDSGLVVLQAGKTKILFDAGPFGPGNAGHSHADTLSLVAWSEGHEILIDIGTYSYIEPDWRHTFRGTAAHNTIRINGRDQATPSGPFRWTDKPAVTLVEFTALSNEDVAVAECTYGLFTHRRTLRFRNGDELSIVDEVSGPEGIHLIEQFWHGAQRPEPLSAGEWQLGVDTVLSIQGATCEPGWRSPAFAAKQESPVIVVRQRRKLPARLEARIRFGQRSLSRDKE